MPPSRQLHQPRWYLIPLRVLLITFILTLLSFAVALLLGIVGTIILAALHRTPADMTQAYRHVALPVAVAIAAIVFIGAFFVEIRHYRQTKALIGIERAG
jgi:uncharacterized BrkB/YihY/UPF0761 family membrane protein